MLEHLIAHNASEFSSDSDGSLQICAPSVAWAYAATLAFDSLPPASIGLSVEVDLEVAAGRCGLFLADPALEAANGQEMFVGEVAGRSAIVLSSVGASPVTLCIRNAEVGSARIRIYAIRSWVRKEVDITDCVDDVLPIMLRSPGPEALTAIAARVSKTEPRTVRLEEIGRLACRRAPIAVPFARIFDDRLGALVLEQTDVVASLVPTYDHLKTEAYYGRQGPEFVRAYLRQSTIRIYKLIRLLETFGLETGSTILEIGSLFGQFSLTLQCRGYQVTAVDRYRSYAGAYDGFTGVLRAAGATVVEVDLSDEAEAISRLGQFDAVISMAVIEHIPHTPRGFVEMLGAHVRAGGVLALDTPNIARYWNRRAMAEGASIHQSIEGQYFSAIPFAGHHREYTRAEMAWILGQAGCRDVRTELFDYNLLQFTELWPDHVRALLEMNLDPTLADTVLAAGVVDV